MKPSTDVWATNAAGDKRRFTRMSWDLLKTGKDGTKDGWKELPDTIIHNTVQKTDVISKPSTGSKTQIIQNTITDKKDQVIDNKAGVVDNKDVIIKTPATDAQKSEFFKAAEGLKKGDIKDYFDKQDPAIEYSNSWKPNAFIEKLGEHLNYDIVELQKAFN